MRPSCHCASFPVHNNANKCKAMQGGSTCLQAMQCLHHVCGFPLTALKLFMHLETQRETTCSRNAWSLLEDTALEGGACASSNWLGLSYCLTELAGFVITHIRVSYPAIKCMTHCTQQDRGKLYSKNQGRDLKILCKV